MPERLSEARRVLGICNTCGYCNGFCDLFAAARRRPALLDPDLVHLANLCHGCRNCLYACQYAPPHVFAVNVPRVLAATRQHSYARHAWPRAWSALLAHGAVGTWVFSGGIVLLLLAGVLLTVPPEVLFAAHAGDGAFYRIVPWSVMVLIGVLPLGWSLLTMGLGLRRYWRATRPPDPIAPACWWRAVRDVLTLRNQRGGGPGCNDLDDRMTHWRRWLHQSMLAGFLLCFAATLVASLYHHVLGLAAPYPLFSPPVLLGTFGGIAMTIAALGLAWLHWREDPTPTAPQARAADRALLTHLVLVAGTGLALLAWRDTPAMGLLLVVHLGTVLAFFLALPYGKFVHSGYRFLALVIEAAERGGDDPRADHP